MWSRLGSGLLLGHAICSVNWNLNSKEPMISLMLCSHPLEILNNFFFNKELCIFILQWSSQIMWPILMNLSQELFLKIRKSNLKKSLFISEHIHIYIRIWWENVCESILKESFMNISIVVCQEVELNFFFFTSRRCYYSKIVKNCLFLGRQ